MEAGFRMKVLAVLHGLLYARHHKRLYEVIEKYSVTPDEIRLVVQMTIVRLVLYGGVSAKADVDFLTGWMRMTPVDIRTLAYTALRGALAQKAGEKEETVCNVVEFFRDVLVPDGPALGGDDILDSFAADKADDFEQNLVTFLVFRGDSRSELLGRLSPEVRQLIADAGLKAPPILVEHALDVFGAVHIVLEDFDLDDPDFVSECIRMASALNETIYQEHPDADVWAKETLRVPLGEASIRAAVELGEFLRKDSSGHFRNLLGDMVRIGFLSREAGNNAP
jgi:hypothetical protein